MQRIKITKQISEIEVLTSNSEKLTNSLAEVIDRFNLKKHFELYDFLKSKGYALSSLLGILIILPFAGMASIYALMKHGIKTIGNEAEKDAYYDVKNNEFIDWRQLLFLHAKRFKYLVSNNIGANNKKITALIFDDTLLEKTGKKIEKASIVNDHVTGGYILGFKLLVCGFWDGDSFIPLDFSLHREKGTKQEKLAEQCIKTTKTLRKSRAVFEKNKESLNKKMEKLSIVNQQYIDKPTKGNLKKLELAKSASSKVENQLQESQKQLTINTKAQEGAKQELKRFYSKGRLYGLTAEERKAQFKKLVSTKSQGFKRRKESERSKVENMLMMLSRAVKHGVIANYVLVDSWFFCLALVEKLQTIKKGAIKLVSMVKVNNQIFTDCSTGKDIPIKTLLIKNERQAQRCKKLKSKYIKKTCKYKGNRVNLFFIKMGKSTTWHLLLTTDLNLDFIKLMEIYQIRWSIEVFFKESKQYLNLGQCKASNFDAQIADTTISMLQYIMLCYCKRINYQFSFGELYKDLNKELVELSLVSRLLDIFWELVEILCCNAGIDFIILQKDIMGNEDMMAKFLKLIPEKVIHKAA